MEKIWGKKAKATVRDEYQYEKPAKQSDSDSSESSDDELKQREELLKI